MSNIAWAKAILDQLFRAGVDEIVLCPGARNAPFVETLAHWKNGKVHSFFEERSGAFFALGRIAATGKPKAIITTSGTAVANLLPAVIEAHYAGLPLVVISADRPKNFRGTGSPQTIVQPGIFSSYAQTLGDWERGEISEIRLHPAQPSHLNVCFDEPLLDEKLSAWSASPSELAMPSDAPVNLQPLLEIHEKSQRPLILVGGVAPSRREFVYTWLKKQNCPIYLEGTSGLRGALPELELIAAEKTARLTSFDAVIRIGQVPTIRLWRDLEKSATPVVSISDLPFSGLARKSAVVPFGHEILDVRFEHVEMSRILAHDRDEHERLLKLLQEFSQSEPALMHQLSQQIQANDSVYIGNSLPIREWDLAARRDVCFQRTFGNRGANGIDGQLSTFFGWASENSRNWGIFGDLTAMYDLSAPWSLRARELSDWRVVIINNGGGKIFAPMFQQPLFENRHETSFEKWAEFWKLDYVSIGSGNGSGFSDSFSSVFSLKSGIVEILPDNEQTTKLRGLW
jgi:2-succinyl-5-enolpyruvyl-6-hydroxy-3-cyclohexene-1-carboxylate synthase